jgi:DNA-binding transcriptional regulator LsrR (DeoR family)
MTTSTATQQRLTDADILEILQRHERGNTQGQIAMRVGCSRSSVQRIIRKHAGKVRLVEVAVGEGAK